jgi:Ca-activated chloride channel family protein
MRFVSIWFLFFLPIIPILIWLIFRNTLKKITYLPYSSIKLLKQVAKPTTKYERIPIILRGLSLAFIIISLARPQLGKKTEEIHTYGVDIILCIDTSGSMRAEDFKPKNRLNVAKEVSIEFVKGRPNDKIGIVVFAGISFTQCPLTLDHGAVIDFIKSIEVGMTQTENTAIGTAIVTCLNRLKESKAKSKIIILVTDGRNNSGEIDPITAAKTAADMNVKIYTIGVGGKGPAPYPFEHPIFGKQYGFIEEDLDEDSLMKIAELTNGKYFRATTPKALSEVYAQIDKLEKSEIKVTEYVDYTDLYPSYLMIGFILLLCEIYISNTVLRGVP